MIKKNIWTTGDAVPTFSNDFGFGTHSLTPSVVGDYLQLSYSMQGGIGNAYLYVDATSITDYTIDTGDYLEYDVYFETADAQIGIDFGCTDATSQLRDSGANDQNGFSCHPNTTTYGTLVNSRWYHRRIPVTTLWTGAAPGNGVGKTVSKWDFVCEYDGGGTVIARMRNVWITDGEVNKPGNYGRYIGVSGGMSRSENAT